MGNNRDVVVIEQKVNRRWVIFTPFAGELKLFSGFIRLCAVCA